MRILIILEVIAATAVLLGLFYRFWFLRDPVRIVPKGDNIVSPADGKVIEIRELCGGCDGWAKRTEIRKGRGIVDARADDVLGHGKNRGKDEKGGKKGYLITIFMNPFDVHYQRAPYDGTVIYTKHKAGSFRSAGRPRPENESNQILISTRIGRMKVIQIAGFIVRRIEHFVRNNQKIKKGQKIGLIRLGSQVCLMMPKAGLKLKVREGQKVRAGESIIAEM